MYLVIHSTLLNAHQFDAMLRLAVITDFIMIKITVIDQNKAASHVWVITSNIEKIHHKTTKRNHKEKWKSAWKNEQVWINWLQGCFSRQQQKTFRSVPHPFKDHLWAYNELWPGHGTLWTPIIHLLCGTSNPCPKSTCPWQERLSQSGLLKQTSQFSFYEFQ